MNLLKNKYFILGNILLLLAVIPLTLFVVKRQTNLRSKAAATTVLSITPATSTVAVGNSTTFDIFVDPGQNIVSIVEMTVAVNPDTLEIVSLTNNDAAFPVKLKGPTINADGTVNLSVSTSNDTSKAIQTKTKVATLTVKGKAATSGAASIIRLDKTKSQVFSLATADGATENVLSDSGTASVTVTGSGGVSSGTKPACTSLTLGGAATGPAPFALTLTGAGTSGNGTITKATFTFGDNTPAQNIISGNGIGTNSVSVQISHTYIAAGTYNATVTFTDNANAVSDIAACTKTVTVTAGAGGGTVPAGLSGTPGASGTPAVTAAPTAVPTIAPTAIPTAIPTAVPTARPIVQNPQPTLPVTGTIETTFAVLGGVGIALAIGVFHFVL